MCVYVWKQWYNFDEFNLQCCKKIVSRTECVANDYFHLPIALKAILALFRYLDKITITRDKFFFDVRDRNREYLARVTSRDESSGIIDYFRKYPTIEKFPYRCIYSDFRWRKNVESADINKTDLTHTYTHTKEIKYNYNFSIFFLKISLGNLFSSKKINNFRKLMFFY